MCGEPWHRKKLQLLPGTARRLGPSARSRSHPADARGHTQPPRHVRALRAGVEEPTCRTAERPEQPERRRATRASAMSDWAPEDPTRRLRGHKSGQYFLYSRHPRPRCGRSLGLPHVSGCTCVRGPGPTFHHSANARIGLYLCAVSFFPQASGVLATCSPCRILVCKKVWTAGSGWGQWKQRRLADGSIELIPFGDRCDRCNPVYQAHETEGPWESVADKTNASEEQSAKWVKEQEMAAPGATKPWLGTEVALGRTAGTLIKSKFRGWTPAQFKKAMGRSHEELGYRLALLADTYGNLYQGLLMLDDGTLPAIGLRYIRYLDVHTMMKELMMKPEQQLHANQGRDVFNFLNQAERSGGKEDQVNKFMRLNGISPDDVNERIQAVERGENLAARGLEGDGDLPLSQEGDVLAEEVEETVLPQLSITAPAMTPPKKKPRLSRGSKDSMSSALDTEGDPRSPTTQKINGICLDDLLSGLNRAQKVRRFKEYMEERKAFVMRLEDPNEKKIEMTKVARLEKAWNTISVAQSFGNKSTILGWSDEEYVANVKTLQEYGAMHTDAQELTMVDRFITKDSEKGRQTFETEDWDDAIDRAHAQPNLEEDGDFDPLNPTLRELTRGDDQICEAAEEIALSHFLQPLLNALSVENKVKIIDLLQHFGNRYNETNAQCPKVARDIMGRAGETGTRTGDPWNTDRGAMEHGPGGVEHGPGRLEHGPAAMEHGPGRMEHGPGRGRWNTEGGLFGLPRVSGCTCVRAPRGPTFHNSANARIGLYLCAVSANARIGLYLCAVVPVLSGDCEFVNEHCLNDASLDPHPGPFQYR